MWIARSSTFEVLQSSFLTIAHVIRSEPETTLRHIKVVQDFV